MSASVGLAINAPKPHLPKSEPFLKWAGGKRWLMYRYKYLLPENYSRYIEPFLGSGAVYFSSGAKNAILSDKNKSLIDTYRMVRDAPRDIEKLLQGHQSNHSKEHYYLVRDAVEADPIIAAANFIYLNRSCWNGLYRVNKMGRFNVPIGTKVNIILPNDDFECAANYLSAADLNACDFAETLQKASSGDFIFVDPPYTVRHDNNGFVKYNESIFSWSDQCRLRIELDAAAVRGAKILVTNANHESIKDLYNDFGEIIEVNRSSVISGMSHGRVKATELIIRNFR